MDKPIEEDFRALRQNLLLLADRCETQLAKQFLLNASLHAARAQVEEFPTGACAAVLAPTFFTDGDSGA